MRKFHKSAFHVSSTEIDYIDVEEKCIHNGHMQEWNKNIWSKYGKRNTQLNTLYPWYDTDIVDTLER